MSHVIDMSGQRFGRLSVLSRAGHKGHALLWLCKCDCGRVLPVNGHNLRRGFSSSCGCLARELASARAKTHGRSDSPVYEAWLSAKDRCHNPSNRAFSEYGGRGIRMCDEWRASFSAFLRDVGERPTKKHSLDRIDNDGDYAPGNVRWATRRQQNMNQRPRRGRYFFRDVNDDIVKLREMADFLAIHRATLYRKLMSSVTA